MFDTIDDYWYKFTYCITHLYIPIQNKVNNYLVTVFSTVAWLLIETDIICNLYIIIIINIVIYIYIYLYACIYMSKFANKTDYS